MSKNNRSARKELERIYGKGCFFNKAKVAEQIEAMGGIKTFKVFVQEKRFKGKPISHQITYHHLKHKSEGGKATVENGANVEEVAHQYLHSLPRDQEEIINNMLREFKLNCVMMTGDGQVQEAQSISFNFGEDVLVIPLYDNNERYNPEVARQQAEEREKVKHTKEYKKKKKYERLQNPTRAMKKRELQKMIEEEEEWDR
ncbi:MAG: hypothetical protein ACI4VQ_06005 [Clostridia bacterium]